MKSACKNCSERIFTYRFLSWLYVVFITTAPVFAQAQLTFDHVFAPVQGLTNPVQQPWRKEMCLNGKWQFQPVALPGNYSITNGTPLLPLPTDNGWSPVPIRIPSPWNINAFSFAGGTKTFPSYPADWEKVEMGWMRRTFTVPTDWKDKRLILHFEAVCGSAQVYVNGQEVAEHFDNSLPFDVDITDMVDRDSANTLMVGVRKPTLFDVPGMFGRITYPSGSPWTREMAGIWQDVYLFGVPALRIEDATVRTLVDKNLLEVELKVRNNSSVAQNFQIDGDMLPWIKQQTNDVIVAAEGRGSLGSKVANINAVTGKIGPRMVTTITVRRPMKGELKSWSPESPNLYGLVLNIKQDKQTTDCFYQRFGWRQWGIEGRNVTLNGKPYQLLGESGHLLGVPYMTPRYTYAWFKAIKDLNGNAIRLHANVRPRFYLDMADEMGIAILDESEIYASTMEINYNASETWQRFRDHIAGMINRDKNHASIFGWSIANEILSAIWWKGIPRQFWPPVIDNVTALAEEVKQVDPTRPWISSDGDGDFHGKLPTYIYHYGTPQDWNRQAPKDKPFGIGEGGSMIWGSPQVYAAYNGDRSFENRKGMDEGIAIETYWYLTEQRKISAFCSVFTLADICFPNIKLGVNNAANPVDKPVIVFPPFAEGQPGMQPEQLSARGLNFNPGYDLSQPLYEKNPSFEAVKAAYAPGKPRPCPWDHRTNSKPASKTIAVPIKQVGFVGDKNSDLKKALETCGINYAEPADQPLLVIDGATLQKDKVDETATRIKNTLKKQGTVFIWAAPDNLDNVNVLLPAQVSLQPVNESALYADRTTPETASIPLSGLYFLDETNPVILKQGLAGPLVEQSRKLITGNSFAQRWYSSDDEGKSVAMIATAYEGGRLIVTSLDADVRSDRRKQLVRILFAALNVQTVRPTDKYNTGFDGAGFINQALLLGSFQGQRYPKILDVDFIGNEANVDPKEGDKIGQRAWAKMEPAGNGLFDFFQLGVPGTEGSRARAQGPVLKPEALDANNYLEAEERVSGTNPGTNSVVYASFWVKAPHAIDAANFNMQLRSDDGVKVWVNTKQVLEDYRIYGPGLTDPKSVPMSLQEGWNHVLIKIGQLDGPWLFSAHFKSSEAGLVGQLQVAATKPE